MNLIDRLTSRFHQRDKGAKLSDFNRAGRRARGWRGAAWRGKAPTFVPRYVRRHASEVIPMPFTWRIRDDMAGRRERKVRARMKRILEAHGMA